jgi:hypothetical protein
MIYLASTIIAALVLFVVAQRPADDDDGYMPTDEEIEGERQRFHPRPWEQAWQDRRDDAPDSDSTIWSYMGRQDGVEAFQRCVIYEEDDRYSYAIRSDGERFAVGVRDREFVQGIGVVTVFYPSEATWL